MAYPAVDLKGKKFSHLTVLKFKDRNKHGNSRWDCKCDCGKKTVGYYQHLVRGDKRSCGKCGLIPKGKVTKKAAKKQK